MIILPISKYEIQVSFPPFLLLSLPHSLNNLPNHSLTHSLTHSCPFSLPSSLPHSRWTHSHTHSLTHSPDHPLSHHSTNQSVNQSLIYSFTYSLSHSVTHLWSYELHLKTDFRIQNIKTDVCTLYYIWFICNQWILFGKIKWTIYVSKYKMSNLFK